MPRPYDAIIVGARCAGSPTAMLLARKGYSALLVDRATFPSDTISTHLIHSPGIAALRRWGLQERLVATGCPPITTYAYDIDSTLIRGTPRLADGLSTAYGPRRTVLDKLLLDAAADSGAEIRQGFNVEQILVEDGNIVGIRGRDGTDVVEERARVVIGADGLRSVVASAVRPDEYRRRSPMQVSYYTYWSGVPGDEFEVYIRPDRGLGVIPTHDNLTLVIAGWPIAELAANRRDIEHHYFEALALAPGLLERVRAGTRVARFVGMAVPNFFRKPYGPGWALVGDAGYNRDPITAQGITDAFRDAELLADALDDTFTGRRTFNEAMTAYQRTRDASVVPMYDLTCQQATLQPPPDDMLRYLKEVSTDQRAMDDFVSVEAGTLPVADLYPA